MHSIQPSRPGGLKCLVLLPLILSLALSGVQLSQHSQEPTSGFPLGFSRFSHQTLPSASIPFPARYDEQVGITFTQSFFTLAFNVTAVAFTDNNVGPGYLVNGLTDSGYWYQVGLSYNWPLLSGGVNPGFNMIYEVFNSSGSIYPVDGGAGLQSFSGAVNPGDIVLLSLKFSSGYVEIQAFDWQTKAISSQSYPAYGRVFNGLSSRLDSPFGFFSGLMTEQYHSGPYYGAGLPVTYSETGTSLSSAWMWMDEWNTKTGVSMFRDNTTKPVLLSTSLGQYFSSNGTAEVATAHGLVTGLTPVVFPTLDASSPITGSPGHQTPVPIIVDDTQGATVRFANLTISTSFAKYSFSIATPFSSNPGATPYNVIINIPVGIRVGSYNLTIDIWLWQYLDTQAREWLPLKPIILNETMILTNSPFNPPNPGANPPGSNPPSSGQGPSAPTNTTTPLLISLSALVRSLIIPAAVGYGALVLLAVSLLIRQERKRSINGPV